MALGNAQKYLIVGAMLLRRGLMLLSAATVTFIIAANWTGKTPMARGTCSVDEIKQMLKASPLGKLSTIDRAVAFVTTPFKRIGIKGWTNTGCSGAGSGIPVRDGQHSTDRFWTVDIGLNDLRIGGIAVEIFGRFIRLEIEPGTAAHRYLRGRKVTRGALISFDGPILIDRDGPFLEIHPQTIAIEPPK